MEQDLEQLDAAVSAENTAVAFFTGAAGIFVSAALGWLASSGLTPFRHTIFAVVTIVAAVFSLWFFVQWRLARARRPNLLRALRDRTLRTDG